MALLLDDLATVYLPAAGLSLTFGTNLFAGLLPDDPDAAVSVYEYPGMAPTEVMGPSANGAPAMEHPKVQVTVRGVAEDYQGPRGVVEGVYRALNKIVNQTINGTYYERVEAMHSPALLHRDNSRRVYFVCNFLVTKSAGT